MQARYCYAPYQFKAENCVENSDGELRTPTSTEREALMDFEPLHTVTCLPTSARKQKAAELERVRCSLIGNSFQCGTVAWIVAHWAVRWGYLDSVPSPEEMRRSCGTPSVQEVEISMHDEKKPEARGTAVRSRDLDEDDAGSDPSIVLVEELVRRTDQRGSDVRLDSNELMRPDLWPRRPINTGRWTWQAVTIWEWARQAHITELELRSALNGLQWRFRARRHLRTRFAHLMDSQVALGVATRCRSSSYLLNAVTKKMCTLTLAALARPIYGYSETDRNPADHPTREEDGHEPPD